MIGNIICIVPQVISIAHCIGMEVSGILAYMPVIRIVIISISAVLTYMQFIVADTAGLVMVGAVTIAAVVLTVAEDCVTRWDVTDLVAADMSAEVPLVLQ